MSRVFMAVVMASAVALSGCGRDRNDQAQYGENDARADRYGSAERYGSDANAETRTGSMSQAGQFMVPQDTFIEVSLNDGLNSQTAKKGDEFTAEVIEPVKVNDEEAIPAGATIHGVVKDVYDPASKGQAGSSSQPYSGTPPEGGQASSKETQSRTQNPGGTGQTGMGTQDMSKARITLAFTRIELPDGYTTNIVASLPQPSEVQMARNRGLGGGSSAGGEVLGSREEEQREQQKKAGEKAQEQAKELPADIQSGAVGTGIIVAKNGQHVNLPAGTELTVQLDEALRIPESSERNKGMKDENEKKDQQKDRWDSDPNRK
jgi:hypothetical protein